jgi:hypothetical protein
LFSDIEVQWQLIVEPWHSSLNFGVPLIRADQMSVFHSSEPRLHFACKFLSAAMYTSLSKETSKALAVVLSYSEWLAALYCSVIGHCPAADMLEVLMSLPVWWPVLCGMKTVVPVLLCLLKWTFALEFLSCAERCLVEFVPILQGLTKCSEFPGRWLHGRI